MNAVLPCATETEGFAMAGSAELKPFAISQTLLGRMGRPVDIANAAAFWPPAMPRGLRVSSFPYLVASDYAKQNRDHGVTFAGAERTHE